MSVHIRAWYGTIANPVVVEVTLPKPPSTTCERRYAQAALAEEIERRGWAPGEHVPIEYGGRPMLTGIEDVL